MRLPPRHCGWCLGDFRDSRAQTRVAGGERPEVADQLLSRSLHPLLTPEPCSMAQQGNMEPIRSLVGSGEQERTLWQEGQPLPPLPGTSQQVGTDMAFPLQQDWGSD